MKYLFAISIVLAVCSTACAQQNGRSSEETAITRAQQNDMSSEVTTPTQKLYQIKSPVKKIYEWGISVETLAENPQLNASDRNAVNNAIEEGVLDEMSTQIIEYKFTPSGRIEGWVEEYDDQTPAKVRVADLPGIFEVKFLDGNQIEFKLDNEAYQTALDDGMMFLDSYDNGLESFIIKYNSEGVPVSLSGKAMDYFGGGNYEETYSEYTFDKAGNWTSRIVETKYNRIKQFRAYAY